MLRAHAGARTAAAGAGPPQSGIGNNMVLGADYAPAGQGFAIVNQTGRFAAGDPIALLVNMNGRPFGTTSLQLLLVHVESNGTEVVVDSAAETISNPNFTEYAIKWPSSGRLMGNNPPGVYKFELTDYHTVLARASFYYTG
ncbi:MAG TPA: hypothetical protein VID73_08815 [Ktedonobacterales bacterium]